VSEAEPNIAELALFAADVAPEWEPLPEGVLRVIKRVGGKTAPGLLVVNQCWEHGLVELGLMPPGATTILKRECEHRSIYAPSINPGEGVGVAPYEAGLWFIRRAPDFVAPTSPKRSAPASSSSQVGPKPPRASKKRSRKKTPHGGPQSRRATAVLNRIFPKGYPDEDEMAWPDVWNAFCQEYPRYADKHPSKLKCPSQSTVRRVMGRAE
jgi:hypothetical protein